MSCVINQVITMVENRPRKIRVIKRFLKMKYNINMDKEVLRRRINRTLNNSSWEIA
jgi:cellulose biosynthesis protein BcsQ